MELKGNLENQYQIWQEKIDSRNVVLENILSAFTDKFTYELKIKNHRQNLEKQKITTRDENVKQGLIQLIKELGNFNVQLNEKYQKFEDFVEIIRGKKYAELRELTPQRVHQFEQFTAVESFVGDQCVICMEDIDIDRNMMRLDCDGQHTFCQICIERWFENHYTCPICRHEF